MTLAPKRISLIFWILWVAANTAAFGLASAAHLLGHQLYHLNYVAGAVVAATLQWLILRRWVSLSGSWVLASVAGFLLGMVATFGGMNATLWASGGEAGPPMRLALGFCIAYAIGGVIAGALEWLVLQRWVTGVGWWVFASALSWALAGTVFMYMSRSKQETIIAKGRDVTIYECGVAGGLVSGSITGFAMMHLLRTRRKELLPTVNAPD